MNVSSPGSVIAPSNSVDLDELLRLKLGPVRIDLNWLLPVTGFYCVIFITGIVGNTCTCLVIARNQYMQTATNCYLFNLAFADILSLICGMPLELYTLWHQYPWQLGSLMCRLKAIVSEATAYASILTIVTFSTERYIAICHPIRQQTKSKLGRAVRNITVIWILSLVGATPYGVFNEVNYIKTDAGSIIEQSAWCGFPFNDPDHSWETLILCTTFLFFIVPMTIIIVLYALIASTLRESRNIQRSTSESRSTCRTDSDRYKSHSRRIVVRMLVAVVLAFFVCWAPFHSQRLLFVYVSLYGTWTKTLLQMNTDLYLIAGCFFYSNATINPILYSVMSNRFRVAFREKLCTGKSGFWCLFCCCCCCWKPDEVDNRGQNRPSAYRNSHSQSSVKSQLTYPVNNNVRSHTTVKNNTLPPHSTLSSHSPVGVTVAIEHSDSFPTANVSWTRNPHYESISLDNGTTTERRSYMRSHPESHSVHRRHHFSEPNFNSRLVYKRNNVSLTALNIKPNNIETEVEVLYYNQETPQNINLDTTRKDEDELVLAQELQEIIGPEIAKLSGEKEGAGCLNCTNCNLLFHASSKSGKRGGDYKQEYAPVDDTDLSQIESSNSRAENQSSSNTTESCA